MTRTELYFFDMTQDIQARLAYLGFQLLPPRPDLRPYVQSYWLMRRDRSLSAYHEEFMHARGNFGLVLNLADGVRLDNQPLDELVFLDGANSQSRKMGFDGQVHLLGIQFRIGSAYPVLEIPLGELNNQTSLLSLLGEDHLLPLYDRAQAARTPRDQITAIEDWLIRRLSAGRKPDALVWASLRLIEQGRGMVSIERLASHLAISQRQLERLYHTQVGLSPKQYAGLLRVDAARQALKRGVRTSLTDLGLQLGFYDQSHFIREFKAVIGMTPSAYLGRSQAILNQLPD